MGSSISGILAILFTDKLETIALSSDLLINPYKRYVDDIYLQMTNEERANQFHHTVYNLHPKLFEIEEPEVTPNGLSLCECRYSISKLPYPRIAKALSNSTKKFTKKPLFVHHYSAIPKEIRGQFHSQ